MRILFLLPDFPYPASTGGRLKVFNILKHLSKRHQCDILCFGKLDDSNKAGLIAALPNIRVLGVISPVSGIYKWVGVLWNLARGLPPSFASFSGQKYVSALRECLARSDYDLVHYDLVNMAQYLPLGSKIASVHSPNDATSLIYFHMAESTPCSLGKARLLVSAILLRRFERETYCFFNKIHVVSQDDAAYLMNLGASINVATIPIAVDEAFLNNVDFKNDKSNALVRHPRIVCTGNLGNPAIAKGVQDFVNIALPLIWEQVPNVRFVVLGQNVSRALQEQLIKTSNIEFCTWVEDYQKFLADADVVLVPDNVGPPGAKTRTLQAMGLGLPVVGTETGFAGIPFVNGEHGLLYKTMPECAGLILSLLNNKGMCENIGKKAHQLVMDEFSLSIVGPMYEKLYQEAIAEFDSHRCVQGID
ncbi:MAG: glycosyltransferase family 4 protein [Methylobacter sp.]|jgi:glycosyltransferase involved in cell wall biosynthesis